MGRAEGGGVRVRGASIVIDFRYRGVRCRETLSVEPTKSNLLYARRLRDTILLEIERLKALEWNKWLIYGKLIGPLMPPEL